MTAADHSPEFVSLCCLLFGLSETADIRDPGSLHDIVCPEGLIFPSKP